MHPIETTPGIPDASKAPPVVPTQWKITPAYWALLMLGGVAAVAAFYPGVDFMVAQWNQVEEFSYGYFVPLVAIFLIWQRADVLRGMVLRGAWAGLVIVLVALLIGMVGNVSAIRSFSQYGFVLALAGFSVCLIGWTGTRVIAMPLVILLFMVPLPQFLLRELSQQLQLISSQLGVALIRLFDISVFLEGNVIDLGSYKLQVVEACSGLRYLFPLMVLGVLAAYFFQGARWKRVLIVVSTVPLTIVINSLRIGVIGVTVEYWGSAMAEGLLHDFEGFFMFMVCLVLLLGEMTLLARLGRQPAPLRTVFGLEFPAPFDPAASVAARHVQLTAVLAAGMLGAAALALFVLPERAQIRPARSSFASFPLQPGEGWSGRPDRLDAEVLATLAVDDYLLVNFSRTPPTAEATARGANAAGASWVNLYVAYYATQSSGQSSHSPRTCIPGGGWAISRITDSELRLDSGPLRVNRALIQKGDDRQLVYYWFDQRGRRLTDEFEVKWHILRDALWRGRSDGALVRLVTPLKAGETEAQGDQRLADFLRVAQPRLAAYVPS
jgi:exosortase D (VPLPA-CTERM-specific)